MQRIRESFDSFGSRNRNPNFWILGIADPGNVKGFGSPIFLERIKKHRNPFFSRICPLLINEMVCKCQNFPLPRPNRNRLSHRKIFQQLSQNLCVKINFSIISLTFTFIQNVSIISVSMFSSNKNSSSFSNVTSKLFQHFPAIFLKFRVLVQFFRGSSKICSKFH